MSYLDESEYDDRDRDREERPPERGDEPRSRASRPARPARPAWDAGTYGTRDELRRPSPPRREPPSYDPPRREPLPYEPPRREPLPYEPPYEPASYDPPRRQPAPFEPPYEPASYDPPPYAPSAYHPPAYEPAPSAYAPAPSSPAAPSSSRGEPGGLAGDRFGGEGFGGEGFGGEGFGGDRFAAGGYPGGRDEATGSEPHQGAWSTPEPDDQGKPRAGRNLPAAIGVGLGLGAVAAGSLIFWRPAFLGVLAVVVGIGIWELVRAIRTSGVNPPLIPLVGGGALMTGLAWWGQADALTFGLLVTVLAAMVWRLGDGAVGYGRDVTAATLVAVYLPFLAGFAAMLASPPDGDLRVVVTLAGVVLSDTGGYIAGVLFGRHPMAPLVSPKKSWEGLLGSLLAAGAGGAVLLHLVYHVHWYWGAVFGLAVSAAAVVGDLGESMIKRDLGVKDMSNLLPGHGGFMDRLDSILFAAPTAYALLAVLAPVG